MDTTAQEAEALTCDALCSLSAGGQSKAPPSAAEIKAETSAAAAAAAATPTASKQICPKQFQLPMFLSKTYHMIEQCDTTIAGWAEGGESFVIKNVEKFASEVLPKYFKHSNFSSFARQLNFYGFRKLRTDPILIAGAPSNAASYVRFYHVNFQKDKPELMQGIKRATKGGGCDQQQQQQSQISKEDVDTLRQEIVCLRQQLTAQASTYDRKLADLSYECNRRISSEYDKLTALIQQTNVARNSVATAAPPPGHVMIVPTSALTGGGTGAHSHTLQLPAADFLQSLSQAAVSLHQEKSSGDNQTTEQMQDQQEDATRRKRDAGGDNQEESARNRRRHV